MFTASIALIFKIKIHGKHKTIIDEWSVKDLEDNSSLAITVIACTELGNEGRPGLQVCFMGNIINYEPRAAEQWAYQARKSGAGEFLLADKSWLVHDDQYIKNSFLTGSPLKARIEVKTRSSSPVAREYPLPFEI